MDVGYLSGIEELKLLNDTLSKEDRSEAAFLRCINYGKCLEELVRYTFSQRLRNENAVQSKLIQLIKNRTFKQFLGKSEYYHMMHFIYLASNNAAVDHTIEDDTADLALDHLKMLTYVIFSKLAEPAKPIYGRAELIAPSLVISKPITPPKRTIDISEAATRKLYIDMDLMAAGYSVVKEKGKIVPGKVCIEIEVHNLPNQSVGYVDYVIYDKMLRPIAVIEAKKTSVSEENGAQQARDYADALVKDLNLDYRPIIYYTNGMAIKIQDRLGYPAREVYDFASYEDLALMISRQKPGVVDARYPIRDKHVDEEIINRSKLIEAVQEVIDAMDCDGQMRRKNLLVLPCGVGKTRTAVALTKILIKNDWVKNVLFLADRNNLVNNAKKPFSKFIDGTVSDISAENPDADMNARICICTYNSMMSYLNKQKKEFSVGHFDLIVVDEAHRSIFNYYRAIFDYFDSFVLGLTATPSKALDRSTYEILDLPVDEPTFEVKFEEAVNLHYLVSYKAFDKTSIRMRDGVKYSELSAADKKRYEDFFMDEHGNIPDEIPGSKFYKEIFNKDTIIKMFEDLFEFGLRVDNGNKIGKTLIFAIDHKHAENIVTQFKHRYPNLGDDFCQLIDNQVKKNKTRQDNFAEKDKYPQIVVSVDMMDTGVDIPEIVNLVFFKKVRSRIKFDQMWGRGTRTCENLHVITPSRDYFEGRTKDDTRKDYVDKQGFFAFDYCGNFEYFDVHADENSPTVSFNLNQKIFAVELSTLVELQDLKYQEDDQYRKYYLGLRKRITDQIGTIDTDRVDAKMKRGYVEKYKNPSVFEHLSSANIYEIRTNLLKFIGADSSDDIFAKSFVFRVNIVQLSLLDSSINAKQAIKRIWEVAKALLKIASIDEVRKQLSLLKRLADEQYYNTLDFFELENVKEKIAPLVKYLKGKGDGDRITNFNDDIETTERDNKFDFDSFLPYQERFAGYLRVHFGELRSVQKILALEELNQRDLEELRDVMNSLKRDEDDSNDTFFKEPDDLIIFIRKIIGLDRKTIDEKCSEFLNMNNFNSEQRRLINLIITFAIQNGNVTLEDLVDIEPFSNYDILEVFDNNVSSIKRLVGLFTDSLKIA